MGHKLLAQSFSMPTNIEAELSRNGQPDVIWAKHKMQILLVGSHDTSKKAP
jgi:hypothetical protein